MSLWQCCVMLHLGWFMTSPQNHIEDTYVFGEVSTSLLGLIQFFYFFIIIQGFTIQYVLPAV